MTDSPFPNLTPETVAENIGATVAGSKTKMVAYLRTLARERVHALALPIIDEAVRVALAEAVADAARAEAKDYVSGPYRLAQSDIRKSIERQFGRIAEESAEAALSKLVVGVTVEARDA
jgi:hypothetical protein